MTDDRYIPSSIERIAEQHSRPACSTCGRKTEQECSRVTCDNRRPVTVQVPDGVSPCYGGVYRISIRYDE